MLCKCHRRARGRTAAAFSSRSRGGCYGLSTESTPTSLRDYEPTSIYQLVSSAPKETRVRSWRTAGAAGAHAEQRPHAAQRTARRGGWQAWEVRERHERVQLLSLSDTGKRLYTGRMRRGLKAAGLVGLAGWLSGFAPQANGSAGTLAALWQSPTHQLRNSPDHPADTATAIPVCQDSLRYGAGGRERTGRNRATWIARLGLHEEARMPRRRRPTCRSGHQRAGPRSGI